MVEVYVWRRPIWDAEVFPHELVPPRGRNILSLNDDYMSKDRYFRSPDQPACVHICKPVDRNIAQDEIPHIVMDLTTMSRDLPSLLNVCGTPVFSQEVKDCFTSVDPSAGHQFIPCIISNSDGTRVERRGYYFFLCARFVVINSEIQITKESIETNYGNNVFVIQHKFVNYEAAKFVSNLPVWQTAGNSELMLSKKTFEALKNANLPDFIEYSEVGGRVPKNDLELPECVARISIAQPAETKSSLDD